ncbi:MAG: T9SS type A sorting domain-containing protein [Cyclobacteriaceae bacterium]
MVIIKSILFILTLGYFLLPEANSQHVLQSSSVNNGTQKATGSSYIMVPSVGQQVTGKGTSSGHIMTIGFLPTAIPRQAELTLQSSLDISPDEVAPGGSTSVTFTLYNTGAVDINADISAEVYLSVNSTFEPEDTRLDTFGITTDLATGASFDFPVGSNTKSITIPSSTSVGAYNLFVVLYTSVPIDEINPVNVFGVPITIANVSSGDTDPPVVTNPSGEFGATISATVTDGGSGVATAMLYYKPISGTDFEFIEMTAGSGNTYTVGTEEAWADELGMEGYIIAEDAVGNTTESPVHFFLYKAVPEDAAIPFAGANFDGKTSTYRMFSVPYDLGNNNLLSDVFSEALGEQNQDTWRVFHYNGQTEYLELSTSSRIDLGNAYWFNTVRKDFTINIDEGPAVGSNQDNPFTKSFRQGWNQIGNPYPFEISWDAIQAANPDRVLGSAHGFSNGSYQTTSTLAPWEGVFVFCETAGTVSYPISSKADARTVAESDENFAWKLDMKLTLGAQTQVSSVGMSEEALVGKDRLDEIAVPRFISYLEMTTHHPEFFAPHFTSDIVPLANGYEWTFEMASDKTSGQASISWDAEKLLAMEGTCFLVDQTTLEVLDMRMNSSYVFDWENGKKFKVVYARDGELTTSANQIGGVYPNPFHRELSIPLMVTHKKEHLDIRIVNVSGQMVFREIKTFEHGGKQQYQWSGHDQQGHELPDGLYIIQLEWPDVSKTIRVIKSSKL